MALGGGTFTVQNKVLPGAYINFVSAAKSTATLSDRGVVAMPFVSDWGPEDEVVKIENGDFQKNSLSILGYAYTHPQVQALREVFRNAKTLYFYRLNKNTIKAFNDLATAKYGGTRGNALKIVVEKNIDDDGLYDVKTLLDDGAVDTQTVASTADLIDNSFVVWKKDAELSEMAGKSLSNGADGTGRTGEAYQSFLNKIEGFSFNALGCNTDEKAAVDLFVAFTKRMRDEVGAKFQTVVYRAENADYEGVVSVDNELLNVDNNVFGVFSLVYWVTGAVAACDINKSNTNKVYDGEYDINVDYTQSQLEDCIKTGKFVMHKVNDSTRILRDINSLVSFSDTKGEDFSNNQTIRVLDQIGNDIAVLFNTKYLGSVANDKAGQISLWNDIVSYNKQLQGIRAIENFVADDVIVEQGNDKKTVVVNNAITPVNAMEKLYMSVIVR